VICNRGICADSNQQAAPITVGHWGPRHVGVGES